MADEAVQSPFHRGEEELQRRIGVADRMHAFGKRAVRDFMPPQHREFYEQLPFVVVAAADDAGNPWVSIFANKQGLLASPDERSLSLHAEFPPDDPVARGLSPGARVGLLGIDLVTRRRRAHHNCRLILFASILASSLVFLDGAVINLALPAIGREFQASATTLQWLINGYILPLGAMQLLAGAMGDHYGHRRILALGTTIFVLASIACAISGCAQLLLGARVVQGLGAAFVLPNSLAVLGNSFDDKARSGAVAAWAIAGAVARYRAVSGPCAEICVIPHDRHNRPPIPGSQTMPKQTYRTESTRGGRDGILLR
ncbi:MAG TPA: MFS transporter [Acetobacteraceae bacterium]